MWKKRIPPGKGTEIGAMNYAYQESKHGYTCNIDRRNAALRIWSVYVARYRENIRNDATRQYATRLEPRQKRKKREEKKNTFHWRIFQRRTDNRIVRPAHIILRVGRKSSRKLNNPARIETSDRHEISQPCFIESMNQRVDAFNSLPLVHDAQSTMKMSKVIKIVRIIDEIIRIARIIHKISN